MSRPMLFKVALYCAFLYSVANSEGLDDIHVLNVGNDLQQLLTSTRRHAIRKPEKMIHQESAKIEQVSTEFRLKGRAASSSKHEVIFSIQQQNMDILENQLKDISDPFSANYGKHLTRDEISTLTMNQESANHVMEYLRMKEDVKILKKSKYLEYITVSASVATWESLFDTTFHEYEYEIADNNDNKVVNRIIRAEHYSLSENIASHVDAVFNTVQFPDLSYSARRPFVFKADESGFINIYDIVRSDTDTTDVNSNSNNINGKNKVNNHHNNIHLTDQLIVPNAVTPAFLSSYYNMTSNTGSSTFGSQGIYAALEQAFSPSDLAAFQTRFQLPLDPVDVSIGNHSFDNACSIGGGCAEANLDIQYIMSTSQLTHTTYYYWTGTDFLLQWFMEVANMDNPPQVFSISYGSPESSMSTSYLTNFNTQAVKLSAMGVTIVAASGDDGAVSHIARNNPLKCGYFPSFPTTSPYVTAVGGTQGPDQGKPEIACQGDKGGVITTGGGFSAVYARHEWQDAAVAGYFSSVLGTAKQPYKGYENRGRGYPDVSLIATSYLVMMGGSLGGLFGTSATSPVFAGMISLVNGKRLAAGKSVLGWINPALYAFADKYLLNDITDGWNNCVAFGRVCCSHGFTAVPGWDPVTGLGSIDYGKFEDVFFHLGDAPLPNTPTNNPVVSPTRVPAAAVTAFPTQGKGWFYSTTYTGLNCNTSDASESANTVNQVSGMATDTCFTMYNDNGAVSGYVKVICYPDYVLLNRYSSFSCATQFRTYAEMIFTGCAASVNLKPYSSIHSVGLQCTPTNIAKLPLPQTGKYVTQLTYASTTSCSSAASSFISFRQDRCLPELVNDQIMSFKFALPTRTTYTGNTCSAGATSTNLDTNCHFTDDSVWTELGGFHNNADAYYDDTWLQQTRLSTKWTWNSNLPTMAPTPAPSIQPSRTPSATPSVTPSAIPSATPSLSPSQMPSVTPSAMPSMIPSVTPSKAPTVTPTVSPSVTPSVTPSKTPTVTPTIETSGAPSVVPSASPSTVPSITPSSAPTTAPSVTPSATPSALPTVTPTVSPCSVPTQTPSTQPSALPSAQPSISPTSPPSTQPTASPSVEPTVSPTSSPSAVPTASPSSEPTVSPSGTPSETPTATPSTSPSILPTPTPTLHSDAPTVSPSAIPTTVPSVEPSNSPTTEPTTQPTHAPSQVPSEVPSVAPSQTPSEAPSEVPSVSPSITPSEQPSELPSELPSEVPTVTPSQVPSTTPSEMPTTDPSTSPSQTPSEVPSTAPSSSDQSDAPTASHSETPSVAPSCEPTITPTTTPSQSPSQLPSLSPTQAPTNMPTTTPSITPTVQLSNTPTSAPTTVPTASPTPTSETRSPTPVPSASQSYEFSVQQGMDGVSADTYRSNEAENNAVFCKTVTVTLDLPTSACKVTAVSDKPTTRKLRNTGTTHDAQQHTLRTENNVKVKEVTASVLIDYLITYNIITLGYANQPGAAYDTLIATLTTAITNNDFAALLQEYASQNSIAVFDAVTLADFLPSTYTVAPEDTPGGDSSSGGDHNVLLIAVLCGVIGGLLCLSPCVYAYWFYNYGKNGSSGSGGNGTHTPKKVSDHAAAGENDTAQHQEQQQKQHGVVSGYSVVPVTPSEENL